MTLYFHIDDVLDAVEKNQDQENRFKTLISVSDAFPALDGHTEDVFLLSSSPKLLEMDHIQAPHQLAMLLEDVPLYQINMELILDEALTERHHNKHIEAALKHAFTEGLPHTLQTEKTEESKNDRDGLQHPMLSHMDTLKLCTIYLNFLNALEEECTGYGFEKNILGKHTKRFTDYFDGFTSANKGKIKAEILIGFGLRQDHDPSKPLETYLQDGQNKAMQMRIEEPNEIIWAWLEADHYQMRRCLNIDRLLHLQDLPRTPNWISTDIFCLLEREAMKQSFATLLTETAPGLEVLNAAPQLKKAIMENAEGQVNDLLQQLLSQTLNVGTSYSGAAERFAKLASVREKEAHTAGLI